MSSDPSHRVAIVAGPHDVLREGWDEVARRWAGAIGLEVEVRDAGGADELDDEMRAALASSEAVILAPGALTPHEEARARLADPGTVGVEVVYDEVEVAPTSDLRRIHGRGFAGLHWGLRHVAATLRRPPRAIAYGSHAEQVGDLRLPGGGGPHPVAVLIHGGFWRDAWERDTLDHLAAALTDRGWATWNVGYRRVGRTGGGWPATWDDVATAADHLERLADDPDLRSDLDLELDDLDLDRRVLVGHSVGGALACWLAARGADGPRRLPTTVVPVAALLDLRQAAQVRLGDDAVVAALGDPAEHRDRYRSVSPIDLVPLGIPTQLVHGGADEVVRPVMSRAYETSAAAAGDDITFTAVPDADHFDPLMPERPAGTVLLDLIEGLR